MPKCKLNLAKVLSAKEDLICVHPELNPTTAQGSKFWAEVFIEQDSMNNTDDSPQYKRLDMLSELTSVPYEEVYEKFVVNSNYSHWVREIIEALATEKV